MGGPHAQLLIVLRRRSTDSMNAPRPTIVVERGEPPRRPRTIVMGADYSVSRSNVEEADGTA